jgi:hypothetical protein
MQCKNVALVACHDQGIGDSGGGAVSWRTIPVDTIKQHIVAFKGWGHNFSCAVDSGTLVVGDWPLHLLRPFGTPSPRFVLPLCGRYC